MDELGIRYEVREYLVDLNDLSAPAVAAKIRMPIEQVFKTLLCSIGARDYVFAVIPGDAELDFKKLARAAGVRNAELAGLKDVQPLTGYVRGGVTVLAARKAYPAFADETIELHDQISVSAGQRGLQLVLAPGDYLRAAEARVAELTRSRSVEDR